MTTRAPGRGPMLRTAFATLVVLALLGTLLVFDAPPTHAATTFVVNSTGDAGDKDAMDGKCYTGGSVPSGRAAVEECTLRAAIEQANATAGPDVIDFGIPDTDSGCDAKTGVCTISPTSKLPALSDPLTIDGYTQTGARPNNQPTGNNAALKIELSGADAGGNGLTITAPDSTVRGLVINHWRGSGVEISGSEATGSKVEGNFIGTDATGTQESNNGFDGVRIDNAPNNTIGGTASEASNVISGNSRYGVYIAGEEATGNEVEGNHIGVDATGTAILHNSSDGVRVNGASNNTIGGTTTGARNVISGNTVGVYIAGEGATGNAVEGNYIGTDAAGKANLGNLLDGVRIGSADNTVGGTASGARNVISGNGGTGVWILGAGATGNKVEGNYIGTDAAGKKNLGNQFDGVAIDDATGNTIGGPADGASNVISGNDQNGVYVAGDGATSNRILSNSIYANGNLGIDLNTDGATANDPGPNYLQSSPKLTSARTLRRTTTIKGKLSSTPNSTFIIQFFSTPSGTDEGETFIGETSVTTDASGNATFTYKSPQKISAKQDITATATSASGDTSKFSAARKVVQWRLS